MTEKENIERALIKERVRCKYRLKWGLSRTAVETALGMYTIELGDFNAAPYYEVRLNNNLICKRRGNSADMIEYVENHYAITQAQKDCEFLLALEDEESLQAELFKRVIPGITQDQIQALNLGLSVLHKQMLEARND